MNREPDVAARRGVAGASGGAGGKTGTAGGSDASGAGGAAALNASETGGTVETDDGDMSAGGAWSGSLPSAS